MQSLQSYVHSIRTVALHKASAYSAGAMPHFLLTYIQGKGNHSKIYKLFLKKEVYQR